MSKDQELYQDPIREKLIRFIENAYEQKNNIFNVSVVIFLFIIGLGIFNYSSSEKKNEANSAFGIAQNSFINGSKEYAMEELINVANNYQGENAGNLAELYVAAEFFEKGDYGNSKSSLMKIDNKFQVDVLNANVKAMIADISLFEGDYNSAEKYYEDAEKTSSLPSHKTAYQIGKLYVLQAKGDHQKVVQIAELLLENDKISNTHRTILEEIKAFSKHLSI